MLPIHRWDVPQPRALLHVVHGMSEHGRRYGRFASALNAAGIGVWAHDHRGHGDHLAQPGALPGHFADADGWQAVLDDLRAVSAGLQATAPAVPLLLFAHSMGSFMAQAVLATDGGRYRGVVLCGSNGPPGAQEAAVRVVGRAHRALAGPRAPGTVLQRLVFGTYNRQFRPTRTDVDWLSRDQAEVDAYVADPRCGFPLTTQAWLDFLEGKRRLGDAGHVQQIPKTVRIRLVAGDRDPVGENGRGVRRLFDLYAAAGLDVSLQLYPGARHELLNETNRDDVTRDLIAWMEDVIAR